MVGGGEGGWGAYTEKKMKNANFFFLLNFVYTVYKPKEKKNSHLVGGQAQVGGRDAHMLFYVGILNNEHVLNHYQGCSF